MLGSIAQEVAALSRSDRAAILAALSPEQRTRVEAAMRDGPVAVAEAPGRHSSWFSNRIAAAGDAGDVTMTGATRAALLDAVGRAAAPAERASGRSLLQAAGLALGKVR